MIVYVGMDVKFHGMELKTIKEVDDLGDRVREILDKHLWPELKGDFRCIDVEIFERAGKPE